MTSTPTSEVILSNKLICNKKRKNQENPLEFGMDQSTQNKKTHHVSLFNCCWCCNFIIQLTNTVCYKRIFSLTHRMLCEIRFPFFLNNDVSKTKTLKKEPRQGSMLAPTLFDLNIHDLPETSANSLYSGGKQLVGMNLSLHVFTHNKSTHTSVSWHYLGSIPQI